MQTGVCRRHRVSGLWPHDAVELGNIRTTSAPLSSIPLMTADHHGQGAGLRSHLEIEHRLHLPLGDHGRQLALTIGGVYSRWFSPSASAVASSKPARASSAGGRAGDPVELGQDRVRANAMDKAVDDVRALLAGFREAGTGFDGYWVAAKMRRPPVNDLNGPAATDLCNRIDHMQLVPPPVSFERGEDSRYLAKPRAQEWASCRKPTGRLGVGKARRHLALFRVPRLCRPKDGKQVGRAPQTSYFISQRSAMELPWV